MQAEIASLQKAMQLPGVPDDERQIYAATISRIQSAIDAAKQIKPPAPSERATTSPLPFRGGDGGGVSPDGGATIPITKIRAGIDKPRMHGADLRKGNPYPDDRPVIAAVISGGAKQIVIHWGEGAYDVFTEGEARGRLTTALRDLTESRMARLGRWDDLQQYTTFGRAVAYYRAMIEFWNAPPTAQQLAIAPLKGAKAEIFERITKAAIAAQNERK